MANRVPVNPPSTKAGRALVDDNAAGTQATTFGSLRQAVLTIEAEKDREYERIVDRYRKQRDEGRREAVHAIRAEFVVNEHTCHECDNGPMLHAILDHLDEVAGLNANESPPTDHDCQHGMSAHGDNGCIHCDCKVPGFRAGDASESGQPPEAT